jgi:hypothetical protein
MIDFAKALRALTEAGVRFIIIGGAAATAHGSARLTQDLDIVYERSRDNIERLARALAPHAPYLRGAPPDLPFVFDAPTIERGLNFTLTTAFGDLDVLGEVVGGGTYDRLAASAVTLDLFGMTCRCVSLDKLIELKRAAGRPKDFEALAELQILLDALNRSPE